MDGNNKTKPAIVIPNNLSITAPQATGNNFSKVAYNQTNSSSPVSNHKITIDVGKLMFYQKPLLGFNQQSAQDNSLPIQLIFPSGNFGLGIPLNSRTEPATGPRRFDIGAIMSFPEYTQEDETYRRHIIIIFLITCIVNVILTVLMYVYVDVLDLSKVEYYEGFQFYFGRISKSRSVQENVSFAFTLVILFIGALGSILENPTIISAFCYSLLMNFVLGTQSLPSYAYSMRYVMDFFLLYLGLVLRKKCNTVFLPVHMHGT